MRRIKTGFGIRTGGVIRPTKVIKKKKPSKSKRMKELEEMLMGLLPPASKTIKPDLSLEPSFGQAVPFFKGKKQKGTNINQILKKIEKIGMGGRLKLPA